MSQPNLTFRRTVAALFLALPVSLTSLTACGGDDEPAAREAYQPGNSASASPSPSGSSSEASSEPSEASGTESPQPEASDTEAGQDAPECEGGDYSYPVLRGGITCDDAKALVEGVISDGVTRDDGVVASGTAFCRPGGSNWNCGYLPEGGSEVEVQARAKDTFEDPLTEVDSAEDSGSDAAAADGDSIDSDSLDVECVGQLYDLTDVEGLACNEAKGILDPFTPGENGSHRIGDSACIAEAVTIDGRSGQRWTCSRDSGGSFVAYSR